jgi:hypothetical protein
MVIEIKVRQGDVSAIAPSLYSLHDTQQAVQTADANTGFSGYRISSENWRTVDREPKMMNFLSVILQKAHK